MGTVPCDEWCAAEDFDTMTCSKGSKEAEAHSRPTYCDKYRVTKNYAE